MGPSAATCDANCSGLCRMFFRTTQKHCLCRAFSNTLRVVWRDSKGVLTALYWTDFKYPRQSAWLRVCHVDGQQCLLAASPAQADVMSAIL